MVVYESDFTIISFDAESSIQHQIWKQTQGFTDELYKQEVTENAAAVAKYKPNFLISDTVNFLFTVAPELQEWSEGNFFRKIIDGGVKKYAILLSKNIFAEVSIQQAVDENTDQTLQTQYFDSLEQVKDWFNEG